MRHLVTAMLVLVGIIHLLPLAGVLGGEHLEKLYGLSMTEPNLIILLRHRAVLFGVFGLFLLFAAFRPRFHGVAFIAGFISVVSFLLLAWSVGSYNTQLARVFTADVVALVCLIVGGVARVYAQRLAPSSVQHGPG